MPTRSYLSQAELPVTFGLGEIDSVQKVVVRWPNGTTQQVDKPQLDSLIEITQAETTAASKEE